GSRRSNATCWRAASSPPSVISRAGFAPTSGITTKSRSRFDGATRIQPIELVVLRPIQATSASDAGVRHYRRVGCPLVLAAVTEAWSILSDVLWRRAMVLVQPFVRRARFRRAIGEEVPSGSRRRLHPPLSR